MESAFKGFVSSSLLMVAALFVVTAGLKETGVVDMIGLRVLGPARTELGGLLAISGFTVITSAFLNNTPIVAMLIPVVIGWCRKHHVAPSRLLIPLSFTTILGGCCSRIGTSTNLVVDGLIREAKIEGLKPMSFFEIGWAGLPLRRDRSDLSAHRWSSAAAAAQRASGTVRRIAAGISG
ncbi:MAG UNVERIFIED_CONTAM: hypothetical protein LVR18_29760 [Planctomycetaceae bacterium]